MIPNSQPTAYEGAGDQSPQRDRQDAKPGVGDGEAHPKLEAEEDHLSPRPAKKPRVTLRVAAGRADPPVAMGQPTNLRVPVAAGDTVMVPVSSVPSADSKDSTTPPRKPRKVLATKMATSRRDVYLRNLARGSVATVAPTSQPQPLGPEGRMVPSAATTEPASVTGPTTPARKPRKGVPAMVAVPRRLEYLNNLARGGGPVQMTASGKASSRRGTKMKKDGTSRGGDRAPSPEAGPSRQADPDN